jgi:hypothetical protein
MAGALNLLAGTGGGPCLWPSFAFDKLGTALARLVRMRLRFLHTLVREDDAGVIVIGTRSSHSRTPYHAGT